MRLPRNSRRPVARVLAQPRVLAPALALLLALAIASPAAQTADAEPRPEAAEYPKAVDPQGQPLALPETPSELRDLLRRGRVTFELYDPAKPSQRDAQTGPPQPDGRTRFELSYRYEMTSRWQLRGGRTGGRLIVQPQFDSIEVDVTHSVRLPDRRDRGDFYDDPLLRHEMDHVRISTDPRWTDLFRRRVGENVQRLQRDWPARGGRLVDPTNEQLEAIIHEALEAEFAEIAAAVQVRYEELDRLTRHGRDPLPADFFSP